MDFAGSFFLSLTVSINFWAVLLLLCSFLLPPVPSSFLLTVLSTDLQAGGSTIAYPGPALEVPGLGRLRRDGYPDPMEGLPSRVPLRP